MDSLAFNFSGAGFFDAPGTAAVLENEILPAYMPGCRWFGGKARQIAQIRLEEILPLGPEDCRLVLVRVEYTAGSGELYQVPLQVTLAEADHAIARFPDGFILRDALHAEEFRGALLHLLSTGGQQAGAHGTIHGQPGSALPASLAQGLPSKLLALEQSNSSLNYGGKFFVKLFRKLEDGLNPDVEITRFLREKRHFNHVPPYGGALAYERPGREPQILALALGLVENEGDAWKQALAAVSRYLALVRDLTELQTTHSPLGLLEEGEEPSQLYDLAGPFVARVRQLGLRTGQTHLALATDTQDPAFAPEPFSPEDQRQLSEVVVASAQRVFGHLRQRAAGDPLARELLAAEPKILELAEHIATDPIHAVKIRTHGDYHLGQVLSTGDDFILLDFEGEPQRSLAERKKKRSPLRDVAGMLRSFHYAAHAGLNEFSAHREALTPWAELWASLMSRTFLRAWLEATATAPFVPAALEEIATLLHAFLLEKAIYEVEYELNNRPTWLGIPIRGILQIVKS